MMRYMLLDQMELDAWVWETCTQHFSLKRWTPSAPRYFQRQFWIKFIWCKRSMIPQFRKIYIFTQKSIWERCLFVHRGSRASRTEVGRMFLHIHSQERSIRGDTMDIVNLATVQQTRVTKRWLISPYDCIMNHENI